MRALPPGFRVPCVHPSLPHPARGFSYPGPCTECPAPIRVVGAVLWSLWVLRPAPLRAHPATGHLIALPSPGLHASVQLLRSGCRRPFPSGRGPSHHVWTGNRLVPLIGPMMCEPASRLAPPAPPLSILGPGSHSGFPPGPIVITSATAPAYSSESVAPSSKGPARVWDQIRARVSPGCLSAGQGSLMTRGPPALAVVRPFGWHTLGVPEQG